MATYWLLSRAEGGIKLKVREADSKAAIEILARKEKSSDTQQPSELGEYDLTCPKCNSENIEYERYSWKMAITFNTAVSAAGDMAEGRIQMFGLRPCLEVEQLFCTGCLLTRAF